MVTVTIRLDSDVFNRIEKRRGNRSKSEYYRDLILKYMDKELEEEQQRVFTQSQIDQIKFLQQTIEDLKFENEQLIEQNKQLLSVLALKMLERQKENDQKLLEEKVLEEKIEWWQFWRRKKLLLY